MKVGALSIDPLLYEFVAEEVTPEIGIDAADLWRSFEKIVGELSARNKRLLNRRDRLQERIDGWHKANRNKNNDTDDQAAQLAFLQQIGYLNKSGNINTSATSETSETTNKPKIRPAATANVDTEIADVAGPQLVVPLDNARYAINAANARWESLYDALYGTDVISEAHGCGRGTRYNPIRGTEVVKAGRAFLDANFGLDSASHTWVTRYFVHTNNTTASLRAENGDGSVSGLLQPDRFVGYTGDPSAPSSILLKKHGLHCEICVDPTHPVGQTDHASIHDIRLESAVTAIMDCEDSVSTVDAEDKVHVYRNWLGLMRGTLTADFTRNGVPISRKLRGEITFTSAFGTNASSTDTNPEPLTLPGRALMLVRNVGAHLTTDIVTYQDEPVYETMLDALITSACALHDLQGHGTVNRRPIRNSKTGAIYIVKPKMHGPAEVHFACDLFEHVEDALGLPRRTIKMGIMDEERRTSVNLAASISTARNRVAFINTGFLDRTGDEIHTDMEAGPVIPKSEMQSSKWFLAYENSNVDSGLAAGLPGRAQIGKGMWSMPAEMVAMVRTKIQHPLAGASCAWVPSPTAATLHAMHYFTVDVKARQRDLADRPAPPIEDLITLPILAPGRELPEGVIERELETNCQSILGYVVRWVGQGVGCSTVPNIAHIGLMEDLATLRISSQHIANWLHHGIVTPTQVHATLRRMANLVDQQNIEDPTYEPMSLNYDASIPFQAATKLIFEGRHEPNGYTERILRSHRRQQKRVHAATHED